MLKLLFVAGALVLGCSKDNPAPKTEPAAAGIGSGSVAAAKPPAPIAATPEDKAKRFQACWAAFNSAKDDAFAGCFTAESVREQVAAVPEATAKGPERILELALAQRAAFPDVVVTPVLTVASGKQIAAIVHIAGTNTGEAAGMKPTGKKVGLYQAEFAELRDDGTVSSNRYYVDQLTMFHQLGLFDAGATPAEAAPSDQPRTLVGKGDDRERANQDRARQLVEAIGNRKLAAIGPLVADDVKLTVHGDPQKIASKKAYLKWAQDNIESTKTSKVAIADVWAADDIVVITDTFTATLGDQIKSTKGKQVESKVAHFIRFVDGNVVQHQIFTNRLSLGVQLGVIDPERFMTLMRETSEANEVSEAK